MGTLFNMFTRMGVWAAAGGGAFYGATVFYMYALARDTADRAYSSDEALRAAVIGAALGAVIGFFKKN